MGPDSIWHPHTYSPGLVTLLMRGKLRRLKDEKNKKLIDVLVVESPDPTHQCELPGPASVARVGLMMRPRPAGGSRTAPCPDDIGAG